MKAALILVWLALARDTSGTIFPRYPMEPDSYRPMFDLEDSPPEYLRELYVKQKTHQGYQHGNHRHSSSQENSEEHRWKPSESSDVSNHEQNYEKSLQSHNQNKKAPFYLSVTKVNNVVSPSYGDPVMWKTSETPYVPNSPVTHNRDIIQKIFEDTKQALKHFTEEEKKSFHDQVNTALQQNKEENHLDTEQLLEKHQYPNEKHILKTEDGYKLTLFRIPPKEPTEKVVMLMHGLMGSSDDWLLLGPQKSLAYQLSDAGYDVWLGNVRGNKHSRRHVNKHPALDDFWAYNNNDIAQQDLSIMIDYILKITEQDKLDYIGHSQGNTIAFALMAEQPWYSDKFKSLHALAPMIFMGHTRSPVFRMLAPDSHFYYALKKLIGRGSFSPNKELLNSMGGSMCDEIIGCKNVCSNVNFVLSGVNIEELDPEVVASILTHLPAGTSTQVMHHYSQGVTSNEFKKFDYGAEKNKKIYGTPEPPSYDLENVHAPVWIYYSEQDLVTHPKDVEKLTKILPNVRESYKMPMKHLTNMDFQFSKDAPELNKKIVDSLQNS